MNCIEWRPCLPSGLPRLRRRDPAAFGLLAGGRRAVHHRPPRAHREPHLSHHPLKVSTEIHVQGDTEEWQKPLVDLKFGMLRHPAWAVVSYSSGPLAATTVGTKSTEGFYCSSVTLYIPPSSGNDKTTERSEWDSFATSSPTHFGEGSVMKSFLPGDICCRQRQLLSFLLQVFLGAVVGHCQKLPSPSDVSNT